MLENFRASHGLKIGLKIDGDIGKCNRLNKNTVKERTRLNVSVEKNVSQNEEE